MDASTYDLLLASGVSTLMVFLGDFLRRAIFPWLKLRADLRRKEVGLPPE